MVLGKTTKDEVVSWLQQHCSHIQLLTWGGKAGVDSVFFDQARGVEFTAKFTYVKVRVKKNKDALFAPTEEELRKKLHESAVEHGAIERLTRSVQKKYGVNNISLHSDTVVRRNESIAKRSQAQIEKTNLKRVATCQRRYGVDHISHLSSVGRKRETTCLERYGFKHPSQNKQIKAKILATKKRNGNVAMLAGVSLKQIAKQKQCSYSQLSAVYRKFGPEAVAAYELSQTLIEQKIKEFLLQKKLQFEQNKLFGNANIRPDFFLQKERLIIECDGLYWHSDAKVTKMYHANKRKIYIQDGYTALFFRENEILAHFPIVESIILNEMYASKRFFARKCKFGVLQNNDKFFVTNHLMGKGRGRIYTLEFDNKVVCAMQVKWKHRKNKVIEISRFASKIGCSVIGGFSRLLSKVIREERPQKIITFVDLRYGEGAYLPKLGWRKIGENLSFRWCKNQKSFHRMKFPGNTGYKQGYNKIWDCGQAKFEYVVAETA